MFLVAVLSDLCYHLWSLFLFTKSDVKTGIIPITLFAAAAAPLESLHHLPHSVFWIWLHLLQFDTSNQILHPEEDKLNKPYRPITSQSITLKNATILRWVLVPLCWTLSAFYSMETVYTSIALCAMTVFYNDTGFAKHWLGKNIFAALLYTFFEIGGCLVAGGDQRSFDRICGVSVLCSTGVILISMHAQDFKDTEGDRIAGRKTLPIVAPAIARLSLVLGVLSWTALLGKLSKLEMMPALAFYGLALCVATRYTLCKSVKSDQRNYYLYNVWLSVVHMLPAYFRFVSSHRAL